MRESGYDPHVREFVIGADGMRVLGPMRGQGLLTGSPYLSASEAGGE